MNIAEIFHSIQGEGLLAGTPSVFVRTSGCNLRCRWCDTPYASWQPGGGTLAVDEVVKQVLACQCRHVVLTGGEPMVARGVAELARRLREEGCHVTIETAATVAPDGIGCDLASLSPKLAHSTPRPGEIDDGWIRRHEATRHQPEVVAAWLQDYPWQLKFVVGEPADVGEVERWLEEIERRVGAELPRDRVLLMPEGIDDNTLLERERWLTGVCRQTGFRLGPRWHIRWFGNTPGT